MVGVVLWLLLLLLWLLLLLRHLVSGDSLRTRAVVCNLALMALQRKKKEKRKFINYEFSMPKILTNL